MTIGQRYGQNMEAVFGGGGVFLAAVFALSSGVTGLLGLIATILHTLLGNIFL